MPINAYTGLMGSGKSFECVVSVIIPAIRLGRRVVTNVDGIDNDAIRAYCQEKFNCKPENLGTVVHCKNEDVSKADFLPYGIEVDTFVKAGDMVCIDEAWRFWGADNKKILKEHAIFFREHRHYVDKTTNVSCDLVLMVQDISDLNRTLKVVVELSFRTTKMKSLGLDKIYRVEMWEGHKLTAKGRVSVENKKYDEAIFPLYSSYVGGKGKELQVDGRQNILKSPKLWGIAAAMFVALPVAVYGVYHFFDSSRFEKLDAKTEQAPTVHVASVPTGASLAKAGNSVQMPISDAWRIIGALHVGNKQLVIVQNASGKIRAEHPSNFQNSGIGMVGEMDGERLTVWSGASSFGGVRIEPIK